jgi:chlorite dismutase
MSGTTPPKPTSESTDADEVRDVVKYTFWHLRPEWRRLPPETREDGKAHFVRVLEHPPDGVTLRSYSLTGLKAGTEMMVWSIAEDLGPIQELHARLFGTILGGYLETPFSYLGMARRSEYVGVVGTHTHGGEGGETHRRPFDMPYLFVYPFVKKREWYGIPFEERRRIMGEHFRIGHKYPNVRIHTGYSFGIDDAEFILSFEAESPAEFLDLVSDLRPTEASRFTELETPIFTCVLTSARRMLDLADGLP